jgi:hypothetical protein
MNKDFFIKIMLFTALVIGVYFYYKSQKQQSTPTAAPTPTPTVTQTPLSLDQILTTLTISPSLLMTTAPPITTLYLLTEQAILLNFKAYTDNPYTTPYSQDLFDKMFKMQQNENVLSNMYNDHKNITNPSLNCYALYTNVFLYGYTSAPDSYINDYDIIGAYFFTTLKNYLSPAELSTIYYFDSIKKIMISSDICKKIAIHWGLDSTKTSDSTNIFLFSNYGGNLESFVKRLSQYVLSNYKNRKKYSDADMSYIKLTSLCQ